MEPARVFAAVACTLLVGVLPASVLGAEKYSWFDGKSSRSGSLLVPDPSRVQFDIKWQSQPEASSLELDDIYASAAAGDPGAASHALRVYGSLPEAAPAAVDQPALFTAVRRGSALGISWEHHLNPMHSLSVSAEYGENLRPNAYPQDTYESRAVLSWTTRWGEEFRPSLTGSVFIGDETAREDYARTYAGRRYLGFAVGGQMTLFKGHTPYLSYQLRRSYYDAPGAPVSATGATGLATSALGDDALLPPRTEDRSLLTAGWRWQASRSLSLQAEASYGLNGDSLDANSTERSRVFFGTRFDFK